MNNCKIYLFEDINKFSNELFQRAIQILPENRKKKILAYKNIQRQKQSVIAYLLLLYGLREQYKINELVEFDYKSNGKPILKQLDDIHFNISHSKLNVACAVCDKPIGLDIQQIVPNKTKVATRICNQEEINLIFNSTQPYIEFCKLWAIKESIVKLSGVGIGGDVKNVIDENKERLVISTLQRGNYFIALSREA